MISGIGVAGMAIGTAALVVILSVFNGFNRLVGESLEASDPDFVVRPASGKFFIPDSSVFAPILEDGRVLRLSSVLEEQVFLSYEGRQSLARVKGIDDAAQEESPLQENVIDGAWVFRRGDRPAAVAGAALAHSIGLNPRFVTPFEIYYPSRKENISLANPQASLRKVKAHTAGIISVNSEIDAKLMLVPIDAMRELLELENEVSSIEIWAAPGSADALEKDLEGILGPDFRVLNRYRQEESIYKMMRYEKLAIFLILIFVVIIIAFNIYSSLRMLIIEKEADMGTLRAMGAPDGIIRRIFLLEGWMVSLLGMLIGLVAGIGIVLVQQRFGIIGMPGNFVVDAYPVALKLSDLLWIALGVSSIGYLMALLPSRKI
ncbi:MAG: ABC transporter permease [Bacteroidales bacterium]|nr:ABC transporter permease [Bacteroidales bacterium]